MTGAIRNAADVARWRLCVGCGACAAVCPNGAIRLIDIEDAGIRPLVEEGYCDGCDLCLRVCPGIESPNLLEGTDSGLTGKEGIERWGRFYELWEGYSSEPEIRFRGSSGGLCTALSLFCLEHGFAGGALHVVRDKDKPWQNRTVRSRTREEIIAGTGSRYSPASPCEGLGEIEGAKDATVFVGKPCDIEGLRLAQQVRPELIRKTAVAIGFFCAGTPSTRGTIELLKNRGVNLDELGVLRYRGLGWPGLATCEFKNGSRSPLRITYQDSWGFLQKYRPFRCYLCPDLTAEFADISVGDPWYREIGEEEPGRSLILIRSEKGRNIFHSAMAKGYVKAERAVPDVIYRSQRNLLGKRQAIWGRLLAMKLMCIPTPKLEGFHLFNNWLELPLGEKIKSVLGTAKRIVQRNYFRPLG